METLPTNEGMPDRPRSSIVHAEELFGKIELPKPTMPEFALSELLDLGVTLSESDEIRRVEIPFSVQKKLIEAIKPFGLSTPSAMNALLQRILAICGFEGSCNYAVQEDTLAWSAWQSTKQPPKEEPAVQPAIQSQITAPLRGLDETAALIEERGKVYGDPELSHENIGLNWTGMIQQHYQLRLPHAMPAWLIELMMAGFKIHRAARVFHEDNYTDLEAYGLRFAREHQRAAFAPQPEEQTDEEKDN